MPLRPPAPTLRSMSKRTSAISFRRWMRLKIICLPSPATVDELDALGNHMIDAVAEPEDPAPDSTMPPVLTYWGQFLDHELTARTDRESEITSVKDPHPPAVSSTVEGKFRNARSPRFDLDSVYGGSPIGTGITADMVTVISGLRHPTLVNKMRVGTAIDPGSTPGWTG